MVVVGTDVGKLSSPPLAVTLDEDEVAILELAMAVAAPARWAASSHSCHLTASLSYYVVGPS